MRHASRDGNWVFDADLGHSSVFETTHIISSKAFSEYHDFPMPDAYPDYPSHAQLADYFQAYADTFDLERFVPLPYPGRTRRAAARGWLARRGP